MNLWVELGYILASSIFCYEVLDLVFVYKSLKLSLFF